jgi:antitoxin-like ribbon-helix-helix protein
MSKKPNLAAIVEAAGSTRRAALSPAEAASPAPAEERRAEPRRLNPRVGLKQIAGHFPPEVAWQLRELAVERRTTVQALLAQALNDLFQKHGKPEIAPREQGAHSS